MHDSDELDDILNEIRNHQNPHTEDAPPRAGAASDRRYAAV